MSTPGDRALAAFIERLDSGAVYETTEGSRYEVVGYGSESPSGAREARYVDVRYVGPSRGNAAPFRIPLSRLLDEARDGLVWMMHPSNVEVADRTRSITPGGAQYLGELLAGVTTQAIREERRRQATRYGGPEFDDARSGAEWRSLIEEYAARGDLVAIAALGFAVTAVLDRLRERVIGVKP